VRFRIDGIVVIAVWRGRVEAVKGERLFVRGRVCAFDLRIGDSWYRRIGGVAAAVILVAAVACTVIIGVIRISNIVAIAVAVAPGFSA